MFTTLELCLEAYDVIYVSDSSYESKENSIPTVNYSTEKPHDVSVFYCVLVVLLVFCIADMYLL